MGAIYEAATDQRSTLRATVAANIAQFCKDVVGGDQTSGSGSDGRAAVDGLTLDAAQCMLDEREGDLDEDIAEMERECKGLEAQLRALEKALTDDTLARLVPENMDLELMREAHSRLTR